MGFVVAALGLTRLNVLSDHDDGKQHELQEGLCDPRDDDDKVASRQCCGKRDDREDCENNCGPHRSNNRGDSLTPVIEDAAESAF